MGARESDGRDAAVLTHRGDDGSVEIADAVPEDVAVRRLDGVCRLAAGKSELRDDTGDAGRDRFSRVGVPFASAQRGERRPSLAPRTKVLAVVQAEGPCADGVSLAGYCVPPARQMECSTVFVLP